LPFAFLLRQIRFQLFNGWRRALQVGLTLAAIGFGLSLAPRDRSALRQK
jgi:hypothetical protein